MRTSRHRIVRAVLAAAGLGLAVCVWADSSSDDIGLRPNDRILVMAPHPDDEVLGCGGVTFLGYPDFGTLNIWNEHWGKTPAYWSPNLT